MPGKTARRCALIATVAVASMRPQRNAGENIALDLRRMAEGKASMRPQRNAGENVRTPVTAAQRPAPGFNEAPAKCRGKLRGGSGAGGGSAPLQ